MSGYGGNGSQDDGDNSPPNTGGAGSSTDFHIDMDALLANLSNLSLTDKEEIEKNCSAEVKDLVSKLKAIKESMKEEKKLLKVEQREVRVKELKEKNKAAEREAVQTFVVKCGAIEVKVKCPLSTTVGALRRRIGGLSVKHTRSLQLSVNGVIISSSPRKTLLGLHIKNDGVIDAGMLKNDGTTIGLAAREGDEQETSEEEDCDDDDIVVEEDDHDDDDICSVSLNHH